MKIYLRLVSKKDALKYYKIFVDGKIWGSIGETGIFNRSDLTGWICSFPIVGKDGCLDFDEKAFDDFKEATRFGKKKVIEFLKK
jgi:hypothetical protein